MTETVFVSNHKNTLDMISDDLELLYNGVVPSLAVRVGGHFADVAEVDLWQEKLYFSFLDKDDFNYAYELIMQTCDKHEPLKKYKPRLVKLFQSDPRFNLCCALGLSLLSRWS